MFETINLNDLPEKQCGILRKSSSTRPVLRIIEENGKRAVVKDFSPNGFLFRNTAGRFLVWREEKAYRKLAGISGIPVFYRSIDGIAIIMEEISGQNLKSMHQTTGIPSRFYSDLQSLLKNIHETGLAHCDLKRAPNIIMDENCRPYVVDWSASIARSEFRVFPLSLIFKRFVRDDINAVIKLKLKYNPEMVSREEKDQYMKRSLIERTIRGIRDRARKFLKKIA
jgi:RIO-like serine/threonine protein kinase